MDCASGFFDHHHEDNKPKYDVDYEIGVWRHSLRDPQWNAVLISVDASEEFPTVVQSFPLPRTIGSIAMIVTCLYKAPPSSRLRIAVPDLNIVHFLSSASTSDIDDPHLLRLRSLIQATGRTPEAVLSADDGRLRLTAGEAAAKARVSAVESSALYFYPSTHPTRADSWEVRFYQVDDAKPDTAACTYERFLDWGEQEVLRYIDVAVKLGNADRLQPSRLALEDPGMFWQICFRFVECFPRLKKAGQGVWEEKLEEGLQTASRCGKKAHSMPSFGRKMERALLKGGGAALSITGSAYALQRVLELVPNDVQLRVEMDEETEQAPAGQFLSEMHARFVNPEAAFAEDVRQAGLGVGTRVVIEGLVKASHYNDKRGTIRGIDTATARLEVELEGGGQMLKVKLANVRDEASGTREPAEGEMSIVGACKVCAGCKRTESAPGIFKSCKACRLVYYCGKECQVRDWKQGGHRKVCCKRGAALLAAGMVHAVVLPGGKDGFPYAKVVKGGSFAEQMRFVCTELLGCQDPTEMQHTRIQRGKAADLIGVLLFYNAAVTNGGLARGNSRASALKVHPDTLLQFDGNGELCEVRGDAVLLRMGCELLEDGEYACCLPERLEHFELETYMRNLGSFQMLQIPRKGVMTSFFASTPEGEALQREVLQHVHEKSGGRLAGMGGAGTRRLGRGNRR